MADRLSPRQKDFTRAVSILTRRRGLPPTLAEIARELDVSVQRADQLATACAARGAVVREPRVARGIRVVRPTRSPS